MSRMSRPRAVVATGLTLGTAAAGLFLAPAAFAADPTVTSVETDWTVTGPATVVAGQDFTVSGTDCLYRSTGGDVDDYPATVGIFTDYTSEDSAAQDAAEVYFEAVPDAEGDWSASISFPADTAAGEHFVDVSCIKSYNGSSEVRDEYYQLLSLTVSAPTAAPSAPTSPMATPAPVAEFKPGATPNTPGISVTKNSGTSNVAAPGQKIVKVLKGFKPGEVVTVVLHSTPVTLGTFTADANGVVTVEFTLPAGTALGTHTLAYDGNLGSHYEETLTLTADGKALAYTGASIATPVIGGSVLVAAGAGALLVSRRRRTSEAAQA